MTSPSRSQRMRPVHDAAASEAQDLSRELGDAERTLAMQLDRLRELGEHRAEYGARVREAGTLAGGRWRDYRIFLDRLNQAVAMQEKTVATWRERCDTLRRQWQTKRQRLESLERIIERYRRNELAEEARREQRTADAQATRRTGSDPYGSGG